MERSWGHSGPSRVAGHCPRPPRSRVTTILGVAHPSAVWECRVNVRAPDTPCLVPASLSVEPRSGLASGADPSQRAGKGSLVLPSAACTRAAPSLSRPSPAAHTRGALGASLGPGSQGPGRVCVWSPRAGVQRSPPSLPGAGGPGTFAARGSGVCSAIALVSEAQPCPTLAGPGPQLRKGLQLVSGPPSLSGCSSYSSPKPLTCAGRPSSLPLVSGAGRPSSLTCIVTMTAVSQLPAHLLTLAGSPVFELNVFHF